MRAWAKEGVLGVGQRAPRLLLDVRSVHKVSHIVRDLRALAGTGICWMRCGAV